MRWTISLMLACLAALLWGGTAAMAQPPDDEFGTIAGRVLDPAGNPVGAGIPVRATRGPLIVDAVTADDGRFSALMPVGAALISVLNSGTQTATVAPGATVEVTLRMPNAGVLLRAKNADGTDATALMVVDAACRTAGGAWQSCNALTPIQPGLFWAPNIPATAAEYAATARLANVRGGHVFRRVWPLTPGTSVRAIALTLTQPRPVRLEIRDLAGAPMTGAMCVVRLTYPSDLFLARDEAPTRGPDVRETLQLVSDPTGRLDLGALAARSYTMSIQAGARVGKPVPFVVDGDGAASIGKYVIGDGLRQVVQTVRRANGTPAPDTDVWASYLWANQVSLRRGRTDDQGRVVWRDVPPTSLTVWGDGVPAGVTDEVSAEVTGVLPAPKPGPPVTIRLMAENAGAQAGTILWYQRTDAGAEPALTEMPYRPGAGSWTMARWSLGVPVAVSALLVAAPLRLAVVHHLYLPEIDTLMPTQVDVLIPFTECPTVRLRFVGPDGAPVAPLSSVRVLTSELTGPLPGMLPPTALARLTTAATTGSDPDGVMTIALPTAGQVTLGVDLGIVLPPITVTEGVREITVPLPAPLLIVPAGAEVSYAMRDRPDDAQRLVANAWHAETPIYGRRDDVLAAWSTVAPDRLEVWNFLRPQPRETHRLRTVFVQPAVGGGGVYPRALTVPAPLPVTAGERAGMGAPVGTRARPEARARTFTPEATRLGPLEMWTGEYWCLDTTLPQYAAPVRVPEAGPALIAWPMPAPLPLGVAPQPHRVTIEGLPADIERMQKRASMYLSVTFDVPRGASLLLGPAVLASLAPPPLPVPPGATRVSLRWAGGGITRALPIPPPNADRTPVRVRVTDWQPGATLSGTLTRADGTPMADTPISVHPMDNRGPSEQVRATTDATGAFSLANLIPTGSLLTAIQRTGERVDWVVDVPAAGGAVALTASKTPVSIPFSIMTPQGGLWWLPDGGAPVWLNQDALSVPLHNLPLGPGWCWGASGMTNSTGQGMAVLARRTLTGGRISLPNDDIGPSLGLLLPFKPEYGALQYVTLTGRGAREGVRITFRGITPQPASFLGVQTAHIAAVPPGEYEVAAEYPQTLLRTTVTVTETGGCAVFGE